MRTAAFFFFILLIAEGDQFLTPDSSFRPTGGFPSSSRLQSFQRPATCVNPLQKLRLDSSHRSLLLYQLKQRRPTERTRAQVKAEVSTSVKPPLRLADFGHSRQEVLNRLEVFSQPFLSLRLVAHRASRHALGVTISTRPYSGRASVRLRPIPLKLLQFVNQYITCFHNSQFKNQ